MMEVFKGGCHCGAVQFEIEIKRSTDDEQPFEVHDCNCSMCNKTGFLHLIVPKSQFKLLQGENDLTRYTFNTGVAKHTFCKHCGIKSFYIPRSNPDGFSVNVRCLEGVNFRDIKVIPFDGQNWEANTEELAHISTLSK